MSTDNKTQATYDDVIQVLDRLPVILQEARRARRLSLREASDQIGVSFSTVTRIESGKGCTLVAAVKALNWVARG